MGAIQMQTIDPGHTGEIWGGQPFEQPIFSWQPCKD